MSAGPPLGGRYDEIVEDMRIISFAWRRYCKYMKHRETKMPSDDIRQECSIKLWKIRTGQNGNFDEGKGTFATFAISSLFNVFKDEWLYRKYKTSDVHLHEVIDLKDYGRVDDPANNIEHYDYGVMRSMHHMAIDTPSEYDDNVDASFGIDSYVQMTPAYLRVVPRAKVTYKLEPVPDLVRTPTLKSSNHKPQRTHMTNDEKNDEKKKSIDFLTDLIAPNKNSQPVTQPVKKTLLDEIYSSNGNDAQQPKPQRHGGPPKGPAIPGDIIVADRVQVPTIRYSWDGCSQMSLDAGCTGPKGGDAGHGGRTVLRFRRGVGDLTVLLDGESDETTQPYHPDEVTLCFGGDDEMEAAITMLEDALEQLKVQNRSR